MCDRQILRYGCAAVFWRTYLKPPIGFSGTMLKGPVMHKEGKHESDRPLRLAPTLVGLTAHIEVRVRSIAGFAFSGNALAA